MTYTVNPLWTELERIMADLGDHDREDTFKVSLIRSARDITSELVDAGELRIRTDQISAWLRNKLKDAGIVVSNAWWSAQFPADMKRNYSKSSQPNKCDHDWTEVDNGADLDIEFCDKCHGCRIDKLVVEPAAEQPIPAVKEKKEEEEEEEEQEEPEEPEPEEDGLQAMFDRLIGISRNNAQILTLLSKKTSRVPAAAREARLKNAPTDEERDRLEAKWAADDLAIHDRREVALKCLGMLTDENTIRKTELAQQSAYSNLDDRRRVSFMEKCMANAAIAIGYDRNTIAKVLHVTSKHMRQNISPDGHASYLEDLGWLGRCPNPECGVDLREAVETVISHKKGASGDRADLTLADIDPEPLIPTGYQKLYMILKVENRRLKATS